MVKQYVGEAVGVNQKCVYSLYTQFFEGCIVGREQGVGLFGVGENGAQTSRFKCSSQRRKVVIRLDNSKHVSHIFLAGFGC